MSDCDSPMAYRSPTKGTGTSASGSGATFSSALAEDKRFRDGRHSNPIKKTRVPT